MLPASKPSLRLPRMLALGLMLALPAACATAPSADGVYDPAEPVNRAVHGLNKGLDTVALRPASKVYGTVVPEPLRQGVSNVADTLSLPSVMLNQVLQGRIGEATTNSLRLAVNATAGLAGLVDVASVLGMPKTDADFGETLAVWGVGEGPYVELPLKGPSTLRDAFGYGVDLATDPVNNLFDGDDRTAVTVTGALSRLNSRYRYSDTVDSLLYESADSYAQLRLLYLQNRRHQIAKTKGSAGEESDDTFIDPYSDGFIDPYED